MHQVMHGTLKIRFETASTDLLSEALLQLLV